MSEMSGECLVRQKLAMILSRTSYFYHPESHLVPWSSIDVSGAVTFMHDSEIAVQPRPEATVPSTKAVQAQIGKFMKICCIKRISVNKKNRKHIKLVFRKDI